MPADQSQSSNEVMRSERGALSWGPASSLKDGVLALVDRTSNSGKRAFSLVRLNAVGRLIAESKSLPLKQPHHRGFIATLGSDNALIAVHDRKEERLTVNGTPCCFYFDQPRWLLCSRNEQKVKLEEVAFWKGMAVGNITAKSHGRSTSWTMCKTTYEREPKVSAVSRLAFGFGTGLRPPEIHLSDLLCQGVAHVVESHDQLLALVNSGYKEVKLCRLTAGGQATQVASISSPQQRKGEVSEPAIFSLADGYLFLWRYFNKKIKNEQRDGGIWFRTCDRTLSEFDQPRRLSDDHEIPAGEWLAADLGGSVLVVWADGVSRSKQQIRFIRIRSRSELPKPPQTFPGVLPNHVVATKRGVLALSTVFSNEPYFWSLRSYSLDDSN